MNKLTIRLTDEQLRCIDNLVPIYENRSHAIRALLDDRITDDAKYIELDRKYKELITENTYLKITRDYWLEKYLEYNYER